MPEEYLQVAFEIKATCDEISRRLLRWHWEQKPGSHTVDSLLQHLAVRRQESPLYYDRLPDLERKTSWQQLDTTLCMRVLLDPEKDAAHPLDLLGNTAHPSAARRACNAVRTARNEAAHAADRTGGVQAAMLFDEAVERLEEGYAGAAFSEKELQKYYRLAEEYLSRCGASRGSGSKGGRTQSPPEVNLYETGAARQQAAAARSAEEASPRSSGASRTAKREPRREPAHSAKFVPRNGKAKTTSPRTNSKKKSSGSGNQGRQSHAQKQKKGVNKAVLLLMLLALVVGLLLRARAMGGF